MPDHQQQWYTDLEEYIRQGEPMRAERSEAWKAAIGLQDVDGLKTSDYLLETAKEHIEGRITIADAQERIHAYYEQRTDRRKQEEGTREADVVAARIAELLAEKTFTFSPAEWCTIHRRLFTELYDHAGAFRTWNISKKEWVLNGASVIYASHESIRETLEYDFSREKKFSYIGLNSRDVVRHIAKFVSDIWQIHPFGEGNTRATAVFVIKYLTTLGFPVSNDLFAENSWYFRNALVRANYNDYQNGIEATTKYLELFFENLLEGAGNELKNRFLHVDSAKPEREEETNRVSKCQNGALNGTLVLSRMEKAVLIAMRDEPSITQKELAAACGVSERTIKRITVTLQEKGRLERINGKRNGYWKVTDPEK